MLKLNSSSTLSSNSNANSTSEFTSNTLRIIQKKKKKNEKGTLHFGPSFKPNRSDIIQKPINFNELDDSVEIQKEISQTNSSGIFDNSLIKGIETIESIFQLKTTERDLLNKMEIEKAKKGIKDKNDIVQNEDNINNINNENENNNDGVLFKVNNKYVVYFIIALCVILVLLGVTGGLILKYVVK
jgi:hypothetical protein